MRARTSAQRVWPRLEETVVIALAANRLARAVSVDEITAPLRSRIDEWAGDGGTSSTRTRLATLVNCPVCIGWWVSLAVSLAWPGRMRLRRGLAVAGVQVLLSLVERWVSEHGREAIHEADIAERRNPTAA